LRVRFSLPCACPVSSLSAGCLPSRSPTLHWLPEQRWGCTGPRGAAAEAAREGEGWGEAVREVDVEQSCSTGGEAESDAK